MKTRRSPLRNATFSLALWLSAHAVAGCQSYRIATPASFARLEPRGARFDYRAASAYGVALAVRVLPNDAQGSLDFWTEAVDRRLQRNGYAPAGVVAVRAASGHEGKRLQYTAGGPGAPATYWVTLFVTAGRIYLIEAGGATPAFDRARPAVEAAVASFAAS